MNNTELHVVDISIPAGETNWQDAIQFPDGFSHVSHVALFTLDKANLEHYRIGFSEERDRKPVVKPVHHTLFEVGEGIPANHRMFKLPTFPIVDKVATIKTRHEAVPSGEVLKFQLAFLIHRENPENC